jgi:predicted amidohydrolase YtcJ
MNVKFRFVRRIAVLCVLAATAACGNDKATDAAAAADLVLHHGYVYTVDAERSVAEAVAVSGGRIIYVGSDAGVADLIGTDTKVIDLQGRMLMPGFQDSHVHPIGGGIEASACDLNGLRGLPEYRSTILEYATNNPDVPWILGGGWAMSVFGPGGAPSKDILDELVPDRPVFLSSQDGHTGWANSAALAIAGIDRNTPDPVDGRIDRDPETGEPIGSLQEGAKQLVSQHIPETSRADVLAGLRYSIKMLNGYGITSIQDANVSEGDLQAYAELDGLGELSLRVVGSIWWENDRGLEQIPDIIALRDKYTAGLVDAATVKVMQDGVMENYTAVMLEPYLIPDGSRGIPMIDPEFLKRVVSALDAEGFQVHFHAIGDGAVRQTLDAVEEALIDNGDLGHRHHISHLQMIDPQDIPRFRELQVIANFQPLWAYPDEYVTELTIPFIGEQRVRWMYPIKSVLDTGATVAFGSDWSVSTANPFPQIETAISRKDADNDDSEMLIPEERIDLESALAAFTINAAFTNRNEKDTGSIEVGKFADLVVLDQNLFEIEVRDISETRALMTLFQGRVVHDITAQ